MKKLARSGFGVEVIALHKLGYKLHDQFILTREQKLFLAEAYHYYQQKVKNSGNKGVSNSPGTNSKKKNINNVLNELKSREGVL